MKNRRVILLLSGGIDSTTLLAKLSNEGYEIVAVSFQYGQKHSIELNYAIQNAKMYGVKNHHVIELDKELFQSSALINSELCITTYNDNIVPRGEVNAYVPFRNLLFISSALSLAETLNIKKIYLAFNQDDSHNFWDCKPAFIEKLNSLTIFRTPILVETPFINLTKSEVIKLAHNLGVDLKNTITCYQPKGTTECGLCLSCITKQKAMESAEMKS
jgi:7-cyano-7-deazaguanine synthase